ncbi:MAG: inverse autotransporter beta domain-containing protein [Pseudomonadota bacterium]
MQFSKIVIMGVALSVLMAGAAQAADNEWKANTEVYFSAGDDRSYYGIASLIPFYQDGERMAYADVRYSASDVDTDEINLGAGFRQFNADQTAIMGVYGAYDYRESATKREYNQITLGGEWLTDTWDYRANFYFPVSDDSYEIGKAEDDITEESEFSGHELVRTTTTIGGGTIYEEALSGGDLEVGRLMSFDNFEMRGYLGAYRFGADVVGDTTGARARLEMRPLKNFTLTFTLENDDLYKTRGLMDFRWAFGRRAEPGGIRSLHERMTQFVYRDIDIRETSRIEEDKRTVNDGTVKVEVDTPVDRIAHIDNTAEAGGDGTAENPYSSVAECQAASASDVGCTSDEEITKNIFIHTGDSVLLDENNQPLEDQSDAVVYEASLEIKQGQRLVGDGAKVDSNVFEGVTNGIAPIIGYDGSGDNYILKLDNQSEVFGVQLGTTRSEVNWQAADTAILADSVSGVNVQRVFINSAPGNVFAKGVHFTAAAGQQLLRNSLDDVGINGANTGVLIEAEGGGTATSGFTRQRLNFENVSIANGEVGVHMRANGGGAVKQDIFWAENTREDNAFQNIIQNNTRQGILVQGDGASTLTEQDIELRDISIIANVGAGIEMDLENVIDDEASTLKLERANLVGNEGGGLWFKTNGGVGNAIIEESVIAANINNPSQETQQPLPGDKTGFGITMEAEAGIGSTVQELTILGEEVDEDSDEVTRAATQIFGHGIGKPQIFFDATAGPANSSIGQRLNLDDSADINNNAARFTEQDGQFVLEELPNSTHPHVNTCEQPGSGGTVEQPGIGSAPQGIQVTPQCAF